MDTSKEYIEMCEKAVDIQELYGKSIKKEISESYGDFICEKGKIYVINEHSAVNIIKTWVLSTTINLKGLPESKRDLVGITYIWLPRQDQLQDMVFNTFINDKTRTLYTILICLENFEVENKIFSENWSMEQLWLAFVMQEKYNKKWNGKDWVKCK